jgi:competence protein ComEC
MNQPVKGVARLAVTGDVTGYPVAGDGIEVFARLRLPANYGTEGAFDYETYLRKEGVHALGSVKSSELVRVVAKGRGVRSLFSRLRRSMIERIRREFSPQDAAVLRALWLDDRAGLSPETESALIDAGVFHVIAISGFHVAVVLLIGFFLLKRLLSYRQALVALGAFLLFYFLLLEGRSSITRSFLLFLSFWYAALRYEKIPWGNALAMAALIQLVINPLNLFDVGYHLTYLSTAAIVFVGAPMCRPLRRLRPVYRYVADFAITSLSVQVILAPYQAWIFHRIPFGGLLANWIAVPASSALIALGIADSSIPPLHFFLDPVARWLLVVMMKSSFFFSGHWLLTGLAPMLAVIGGFYVLLAVVLMNRRLWIRILCGVLSAGCFGAVFVAHHPLPPAFRVHVIDVGQGDAILLEYPDGTFDLVDGGGFWNTDAHDVGKSVVLPYFSRMGVTRLRFVFLTHAHADHMNGLIAVLRDIPVEAVYVTRRPVGEAGYQRFCVAWLGDLRGVKAGDIFERAGVKLIVQAPPDSRNEIHVRNDDSLVMLAEYQGRKVLLTGDAEQPTEARLGSCCLQKIDVLKVPHHGSRTSSTEALLAATRPALALISVGRINWFGHPHPEVLARYRSHHAMLYRTDRDGSIRVTISREAVDVDCFRW